MAGGNRLLSSTCTLLRIGNDGIAAFRLQQDLAQTWKNGRLQFHQNQHSMAFNHWKAGRTLEFCLTGPLIFAVSYNFDTAFMTVLETTGLCWICKQDETRLGGATLFQIAMLSGPKIKWSFLVILLTHHPRIFCTLYFCRSESVPGVLVGDVFLLTDVFRCHVSCIQQNWMAKDQSICGLPVYFDFADVTSSS